MNYIVQAVILVYFVGMFALGILGEQRTKNTADYYVAGRQVNGFFAGIVYTTSLVSAGALVGWVSQAWQWGIYFIYAASAVTVATFLCWWLLGRKLCTCSRDLNLFTVPDFLEKRFESRTARLIASLLIITFSIPLLVTQFAAIVHLHYFTADSILHKFTYRLSKNVCSPYAIPTFFTIFNICNKIFCLLPVSDNRRYLRFNVCPYHMY